MKKFIFAALCAFVLVGCGSPDPKNLEDRAKYKEEIQAAESVEARFLVNTKYCDNNWGEACGEAGDIAEYVFDNKEEKISKAVEFYSKACDLKDSNGCLKLGKHYKNTDLQKAVKYYEKYYEICIATNSNTEYAFSWLAQAYKDVNMMDEFNKLYEKHCPSGNEFMQCRTLKK